MELWIRSQDKSSIVKVDNLYVSVGNYICYYVEKGKEVPDTYYRPNGELGRYETKERALEVLDEIQDKMLNGSFAKKINGLGEELDLIPNPILIYNMPEN